MTFTTRVKLPRKAACEESNRDTRVYAQVEAARQRHHFKRCFTASPRL